MNTYYGTKVIQAEPMTRLAYNQLRGWVVPSDENPNDEGYLVCYSGQTSNVPGYDGYVSWSPKQVFEESYNEIPSGLQPHQTRVYIEHHQLKTRIDGLEGFIGTERFYELPDEERKDMSQQLEAMYLYLHALESRMSRF